MKRKLLGVFLCFCMVFTLLPMTAFAQENPTPTRTTTLDLSVYTETTDMLETEGWKWEPVKDGGILTLRNCYIQCSSVSLLEFVDDSTITIILEGENILETTSDVHGAMVSDKNAQSSLNLTIREGTKDSSLKLFRSAEVKSTGNPYGIAGNSITIESGTVTSNTDFCVISGDFKMTGGALSIDIAEASGGYGIYTNSGNVTINDGFLDIKAGNTGIWTVGLNVDPSGSRNVYINGGTVKIEAGQAGIQTFSRGNLKDTCNVYITGGDVDITSNGMGIAAKDIVIDSDGKVKVHGAIAALYANEADVESKIEIKKAAELKLTGGKITFPEQDSEDGLKDIVIGKADYADVESVLEKVKTLNSNHYLDFSAVIEAVNGVDRSKNIFEQAEVDEMAQKILDAINALEYKPADYSKVEEAVEKAQGLNKGEYQDFSKVEAAIKAVIEGKNITEQAVVDGYAAAIENAIAQLQYKDADYSKVEEAIEKAEALNKNEYQDFSKVEEAINAVVYGKNITEQAEVDAMAKAIDDAVSALEKKPEQTTDKEISESSDLPQTGDNIPMIPIIMMIAAVCGITVFSVVSYRRKKSE